MLLKLLLNDEVLKQAYILNFLDRKSIFEAVADTLVVENTNILEENGQLF